MPSPVPLSLLLLIISFFPCFPFTRAVTVYHQAAFTASFASSAAPAATTTPAAFNNTVLVAPAPPDPPIPTGFTLQLQSSNSSVTGLSIPIPAAFYGFSIEMSLVTQTLGKNSTFIQVPFLNLLSNIVERGGTVRVRVGGNTQEFAELVDSLPSANGRSIVKQSINSSDPTNTPAIQYTMDFFYMMANISSMLNVGWYLGIPLNDSQNLRLEIGERGENILGSHLLGLQVGNEPDLYAGHGLRQPSYGPQDFFNEFGSVINAIDSDSSMPIKNNLIGPSVATGDWTPEMVWDTGFIDAYAGNMTALTVEHYPDNNCFFQFGTGIPREAQDVFSNYLNHTSGQSIVAPYLNSASLAQGAGKPFIMFETNSASCGGFPGVSDSFGATLWALDYGLQMAYSNFSAALLHVGGENSFYNPFTAPPTNQSLTHQWTVGGVYYSALVAAEIFGTSNTAQIIDLQGNDGNEFTPQYAIYENGNLTKVALFNYVTDPSGASTYTATLQLSGGTVPSQVQVKYLLSQSVSFKDDITWAGQTFGTQFTVDGRLRGDLNISTISCDQTGNTCSISVPAPGFALVFLGSQDEATPDVMTFATTTRTVAHNTATVDPAVLATSNGHAAKDLNADGALGATSPESGAVHSPRMVFGNVQIWLLVVIATTWTIIRHLT